MKKTNTVLADRKFNEVLDESGILCETLFSYIELNPTASDDAKELLRAVVKFSGNYIDYYMSSDETND